MNRLRSGIGDLRHGALRATATVALRCARLPGRLAIRLRAGFGAALLFQLISAIPSGAAVTATRTLFASIINPPAISVRLELLGSAPGIGGPVTYRIVVTNTGLATVTALRVRDTISAVIVGAAAAGPAGFAAPVTAVVSGGLHVDWTATGIVFSPATSLTFTITGSAANICAPTGVTNQAGIGAATIAGTTEMTTGVASFIVQPATTGISVVKSQIPAAPAVGAPITYQIVVTNTGSATLTALTVVDTVAPQITAQVASIPGAFAQAVTHEVSGTRYVWTATGLAMVPGAALTFQVDGIVSGSAAAVPVANAAELIASSACGTTRMATNGVGYLPQPVFGALLVGSLSVLRAPAAFGQEATFVLNVTNTGGTTVTGLTAGLRSGGASTIGASFPVVVGAILPGGSAAFTWSAIPTDSAALTFIASSGGFTLSGTGIVPVSMGDVSAVLPGIPETGATESYVFPSPARDAARIAYRMAQAGSVVIRIYTGGGVLVATLEETQPAGQRTSRVTTAHLAPGVYLYLIERRYGSGLSDRIGPRKFAVAR